MKTIIVKPNGKQGQYGQVESLSAIELPLWASILANYYKADTIIDAEAENLSFGQLVERIQQEKSDDCIILGTGSHPSAHFQQRQDSMTLQLALHKLNISSGIPCSLPVNPVQWTPPRLDLLPIEKYRAHNWLAWGYPSRSPYGAIFTSIGCPFSCQFCCIKEFLRGKFTL